MTFPCNDVLVRPIADCLQDFLPNPVPLCCRRLAFKTLAAVDEGQARAIGRIADQHLFEVRYGGIPAARNRVRATLGKVLKRTRVPHFCGIPDKNSGEAVKVFIVKKDPNLTLEQVKDYLATQADRVY